MVFIILFFFVYYLDFGDPAVKGKILIVLAIISNLSLCIRHRESDGFFLLLIFALTYWIYIVFYYFYNIPYHVYPDYQTKQLTNHVVLLQSVALRIMFFNIDPKCGVLLRGVLLGKNNLVIYIGCVIALLLMVPLSLHGKQIAVGGLYGIETQSSIWFEYCIPFLICAWRYSKSREQRMLVYILCLLFAFLPLLFSKRLPFLMLLLVLFHLFYSGRFSIKYIILVVVAMFSLMSFFAFVRVGEGGVSLLGAMVSVSEDGVMRNNQGGVMVCAASYLGLIQDGYFDFSFRIKSFLGLVLSPFVPASLNFQELYVNFSALEFTPIPGNGGFPGVYFYLWGGYFGVFIFSFFINRVFYNAKKNHYAAMYSIFLLATFPRWYSYNMLILVKMGFFYMLLMILSAVIDNMMRRNRF